MELKDVEHGEEGKGDAELTDAGHDNVTQETTCDQVKDDAHVTLTDAYFTQKTEVPLQSSSVSSDFATQFLNLDNVPPADNEIISMINVKVCHEEPSNQTPSLLTIHVTVIPETSTAAATTIPPPIPPTPIAIPTKTSIPVLSDFSSVFQFNQRVSNLEKELSELKQADQSAQLLATIKSQIPTMVDPHLGTRLGDSIQKGLRSNTTEFKKEAQAENERYIDLIEKSVKDIINDEVKTQLPQIIPKAVSDFATPMIKSTIIESLEDVVLAESSSQPQSTYEAAALLTEFELKKILIDKMEKSQSNLPADKHKELYKALVNSYNVDKDLFLVYGKAVSLKRGHEDKDKDEDPPARSDQGMKRRKTSKSTQAKEPIHIVNDTKVQQNQGQDMGNNDDQPNVEAAPKHDWFKKPERPPTLDSDWNVGKSIDNLTQDHLVGLVFNLLKGTCRSHVELDKPLPLIMDQGRQVIPVDYFINNDLEYQRGGSSSNKYTTSTTKTKAAKYDIQGIEDTKLSNLERDVIFDLGVALRMLTRRIVILNRVEDLQLGVESYQKKLNITKPEIFRSDISNKIPYTAYNNPQGIIYEDKYKRNRLMRTDEIYKFSDETLTSVRFILPDIASNLRMDYLPKRRWSSLDRKRSRIMIKAIDQQLLERRLLEKFVGERDYEEDLRLLQ
ncbi:hypothetical protein Tco_1199603 [Tanacetum coccineum]